MTIVRLINAVDPTDEAADDVRESAQSIVDTMLDAIPRLGVAAVIIVVGWVIARVVRAALRRVFCRSQTPSFAQVMSKVIGYLVVLLFVLAAIAVTFPSVKPVDLLAGLGFFSVAVGFAFQDILENTLSGILLLFRQPFESGDEIEVGDHFGRVERITIRETRLVTPAGELIVIPNRDVYKSALTVQTHFPVRRIDFTVGIAYENDPVEACALIEEALKNVDGVESDPTPEALVVRLGVSTVDIDARFWCRSRQHGSRVALSAAIAAVQRALDDRDIEMPADIVALQATPSLRAALHDDGDITPGGAVRRVES